MLLEAALMKLLVGLAVRVIWYFLRRWLDQKFKQSRP